MPFTFPPSPQGFGNQQAGNTPVINMGAADYIFLWESSVANGGDGKVRVFKRPAASSSWTVEDDAHSIFLNGAPYEPTTGNLQFCCWGDPANTTIFILALKQSGSSPSVSLDGWDVFSFNTATDTWNNTGSPVHSYANGVGGTTMSYIRGNGGGIDQISEEACLTMWTRGPGDYIFFYSGTPQNIAGTNWGRLYYSTYDGTTFGPSVLLNNQTGVATPYCGIGGCHDVTNNSDHFFGIDFRSAKTLIHWSLHAGLLSNAQVVNTAFPTGIYYTIVAEAIATMSTPILYVNGSSVERIAIAGEFWNEPFDGNQALVVFTADVSDTPTWTAVAVTVGPDDTSFNDPSHSDTNLFPVAQGIIGFPMNAVSLAYSSGTLAMYWVVTDDTTFLGHIYDSTSVDDGATWTAVGASVLDSLNLTTNDNAMAEVYSWTQAGGGIGLIGSQQAAGDFKEATQYLATISPPIPPSCTLNASPTTIDLPGDPVTLTWTTTGSPTSAVIDNGVGAVNPAGGSTVVFPPGSVTYTLIVTSVGGTSICQASVVVTCASAACILTPAFISTAQPCELEGS